MTHRPEFRDGTVAARLTDVRVWQRTLFCLQDEQLWIDDIDRFEQTKALVEANLMIARHHLETAPPENLEAVTLLLRYGLSITDDPRMAAIIKSCLITLLDMEGSVADAADQMPDEAFDAAVNWVDGGDIADCGQPLRR